MVSRRMIYIFVFVLIIGVAYTGWKLTSRNAYESAEYVVMKSDGAFELREYPDLMMASTDAASGNGNGGSFGRLFKYISGGNDDKKKIAMTTPVFMEAESTDASGKMSFVVPKKVADGNIPEPTDQRVRLTQRSGGLFAVIRFAGRENQSLLDDQQETLKDWILDEGYELVGDPEFAGYDPPWTFGPLRRNEILIRIRQK
jgi:hypothetical protein